MLDITMLPVKSKRIAAAGHDSVTNTLRIQFAPKKDGTPGSMYDYADFPSDKYSSFMAAESKDDYFEDHIRSKANIHPYKKVA